MMLFSSPARPLDLVLEDESRRRVSRPASLRLRPLLVVLPDLLEESVLVTRLLDLPRRDPPTRTISTRSSQLS